MHFDILQSDLRLMATAAKSAEAKIIERGKVTGPLLLQRVFGHVPRTELSDPQ